MIEKKARSEDGGKLTRLIEDVRKNKQALEGVDDKNKEDAIEKKERSIKITGAEVLQKMPGKWRNTLLL